MKKIIKHKLRENLLNEVSDNTLAIINNKYSDTPIVMMSGNQMGTEYKGQGLKFKSVNPNEQPTNMKPKGLWYGIGSSWIDWVRSEMPEWETDQAYVLDLNKSNMLIIRSYEELIAFDEKYSKGPMINWSNVAYDYDGIEISPYIQKARFELMWYYAWDIASGCIWGENVVKNAQIVK